MVATGHIVVAAAVGSAASALLLLVAQVVGLRLDQRPPSAHEEIWKSRLSWSALAVLVITLAVAFGIARRVDTNWPVRIGLVVVGLAAGSGLLLVAIISLL